MKHPIWLPQIVDTVIDGYADRPALGQRAVEFVTDPLTGRTSVELLPHFDTITYRELSDRVDAVAAALAQNPVRPGDRVAILGFTSTDYAVVDMAVHRLGAISVPLQTSAPVTQLRPIAAETEPVAVTSSIDFLDDAVELMLTGHLPERLVVFDYHGTWSTTATHSQPQPRGLPKPQSQSETLAEVLARGSALPDTPAFDSGDDSALALLIYTSGSTGVPKGAMTPGRGDRLWRKAPAVWGNKAPPLRSR